MTANVVLAFHLGFEGTLMDCQVSCSGKPCLTVTTPHGWWFPRVGLNYAPKLFTSPRTKGGMPLNFLFAKHASRALTNI